MTTTELYLIVLCLIFLAPYAVWRLLRLERVAPLAIVQIVSGIVLGPGVAGAMNPEGYASVFNPTVLMALNGVAWWAVMLFVFLAGVELDVADAWTHRRETALTAACALLFPLAVGVVAALVLISMGGTWAGARSAPWQSVTGIAMACAVTALPILVLLMEQLGILRTNLGQRILRYASLDDVAIWAVLAIILLQWERVAQQGIFLAGFALACVALRKLMVRLPDTDRWYIALVWLIVVSFAADWCGLHYMVGAFLAGLALDRQWFGEPKLDALRGNVILVLMPVFFLSTGLRTTWEAGGILVFAAAAILLVASITGKLAGLLVAGRLLGWKPGEAYVIGWLLQTKALISIVFTNILLDKGVISADAFTALLLMAVGSTVMTIPMVRERLKSITH